MKKYILIIAVAIASLFAYSCTSGSIDREEAPVPAVKLVPLVLNSGVSVKTSLDADGSSVNWTSGDHIAVIDNVEYSAVRDFEAESVNGTSATFVGSVAEGTKQFYAVYPLDCVTGANESSISVTLPSAQNPASGTFAEELNISVASGSKSPGVEDVNNVVFNNLCGLLKFTMPAELGEINEVKFIANRPIAGELIISKETMSLSSAGNVNTVSMTGAFAPNSTFYFVITPGEISGFSVSVTTSNGVILTKSSEKPIQISAGQIKNLGVIPMVANAAYSGLSVAHTTPDGILTGTEVKFTPAVAGGTAVLTKEGNEVRSVVPTTTSEISLEVKEGQPYIPQGKYIFTYSYTENGVNYIKSQIVNVPAPTFAVSVSAETSYSRSQDISADSANSAYAAAPREVRNITVSSGISSEVLTQMGVTYSASITEGETKTALAANSTSPSTFATYTAKSVGSHTLTAICKFDGVEKTASTPCVITGLPHIAAPPTKSGSAPWTDNSSLGSLEIGINWNNNGRIKIPTSKLYEPTITSPGFYSPVQSLNVYLYVKADLETKGRKRLLSKTYYPSKITCAINDKDLCDSTGPDGNDITNYVGLGGLYSFGSTSSTDVVITSDTSLSLGNNELEIRNNGTVSTLDPQWTTPSIYVKEVNLLYY